MTGVELCACGLPDENDLTPPLPLRPSDRQLDVLKHLINVRFGEEAVPNDADRSGSRWGRGRRGRTRRGRRRVREMCGEAPRDECVLPWRPLLQQNTNGGDIQKNGGVTYGENGFVREQTPEPTSRRGRRGREGRLSPQPPQSCWPQPCWPQPC